MVSTDNKFYPNQILLKMMEESNNYQQLFPRDVVVSLSFGKQVTGIADHMFLSIGTGL